jgi:uncharacterized protein (DUF1810 family)
MVYFRKKQGYLTLQILGRRLFECSGVDGAVAIYVFNRAVAFKRLGRWELGNLQRGVQ